MATYELTVKSPTEIILSDGKITERLSLANEPKSTSVLVQEARLDVLQTINLEELFKNLGVCAPLLNITYDAVNGTGYNIKDGKLSGKSLSATITGLKDKFSNTVDTSLVVMTGFKAGTQTAVTGFLQAYDYLTDPDYVDEKVNGIAMACNKFNGIKKIAGDMHNDATRLAKTFEEIEASAQNITGVIMTQRDMDSAKKAALEQELASLNAQVDAFSNVKADLDAEVEKYDKEYNKISNLIEKNSKQEFGLKLASTVTSSACSLFNTVAGAFSTKAVVGGVLNSAMNKDTSQQQQGAGTTGGTGGGTTQGEQAASENLEKSTKTVTDCKARIEEIEKRLTALKTLLESAAEDEKTKLLQEQDDLTKEKKEKNEALDAAQKQADIYKDIQAGMQQAAKDMAEISKQIGDQSALLYNSLDKIADQREEVAKTRRETMMKLAEMTSKLANATTESRDLEVVIQALIMAIGCMRIVKVYLSDIALFWKNVEQFCERLIAGVEGIQEDAQSHLESKNYIKFFIKDIFITSYLVNLANWVALHIISVEYLEAFNKTRKEYQQIELNNKESDPKTHWKRAQENARLLQEQFDIELVEK